MKREIKQTSDGSSTIYLPDLDENYHSQHGAIQEARHVFLKYGIETLEQDQVTVFEMGFGTGLNALLTYQFGRQHQKQINYLGIEAYPVEIEMIASLNYIDQIGEEYAAVFKEMHASNWEERIALSEQFTLQKIHQKIEDYSPEKDTVDIVFFDAFGPRAQSAMWELPVLEKMKEMLRPNGILVTYCAMGQFKRDLKSLGFEVEGRPGPPGKREMTVGRLI